MSELDAKRDQLITLIAGLDRCAVAMSAGVDSTVVAKAAQLALGERALAVTAVSESLAEGELEEARQMADLIGIRHQTVHTQEMNNALYRQNNPDRCYHCKSELYEHLEGLAERLGVAAILNGANVDDLGDYRPGMQAAKEHRVRSPLAECGLNKQDVRTLAAGWELPVWDKPASPCLASRVAYGEEVTPERLAMIDQAEQFLRGLGLSTCRVRYHRPDMARIEVPAEAISRLCEPATRASIAARFKSLGFRFVTIDLEGFRSGSLNDIVPIEQLSRFSASE